MFVCIRCEKVVGGLGSIVATIRQSVTEMVLLSFIATESIILIRTDRYIFLLLSESINVLKFIYCYN